MNRQEFLDTLARELSALPREERESALRYYNDYFDDAGDDEQAVITELGTPQALAADIVREYRPREADSTVPPDSLSETIESAPEPAPEPAPISEGESDDTSIPVHVAPARKQASPPQSETPPQGGEPNGEQSGAQSDGFHPNNKRTPNYSAGVIIAIVCTAPLWLPLLLGLLGAVFGMMVALVAVLFAFALAGVAILIAGGAVLGAGILELSVAPPSGVLGIGLGLAIAGIGLLLIVLMINLLVRAVPAIGRGIGQAISAITGKLRRQP